MYATRRVLAATCLILGLTFGTPVHASLSLALYAVTTPSSSSIAIPPGGFTSDLHWSGSLELTLSRDSVYANIFTFDAALFGVGTDNIYYNLDEFKGIGGTGILIFPGQTYHVDLSGTVSSAGLNLLLRSGQSEIDLRLITTSIDARQGPYAPVPEPSTIALAASALPVGLGLALRRRKPA